LLLNPLVRRTLAPKGKTPTLVVRGRHRQKVSLIAGLTLSPRHSRRNLYFRSLTDGYFDQHSIAAFVRHLLRHLRGRVLLIWDNGKSHRGRAISKVLADHRRLEVEPLPPYAPQLNPVEWLWSHIKWSELSNVAPEDQHQLARMVRPILARLARSPQRLQGFWHGAKLHKKSARLVT
jgi:hypothetical protein